MDAIQNQFYDRPLAACHKDLHSIWIQIYIYILVPNLIFSTTKMIYKGR
jgi:hypothetical protein